MAVEAKRGCGYRKVGGMYLVGKGVMVPCDRLPWPIQPCPTCGAEIKFSRGLQWLDPMEIFGIHEGCKDKAQPCPLCQPPENEKYGLMWVGEAHYTPEQFMAEAKVMGISKRIGTIPAGIKFGETQILLAHKSVNLGDRVDKAIFTTFKPLAIEKIITESQSKDPEFMKELERDGLTPVIVPDDDPDHMADGVDAQIAAVSNFEMEPPPEWED